MAYIKWLFFVNTDYSSPALIEHAYMTRQHQGKVMFSSVGLSNKCIWDASQECPFYRRGCEILVCCSTAQRGCVIFWSSEGWGCVSLAPNSFWSKSCSQERLCCSWHTCTKIGKGWKYDDFDPWPLAPKWTECSSILVEVELGVGNPFPPYAGMKIKLTTKIFRAVDRGWRHMSRPISI